MIIGIDASRAFIEKKTGTETYSYQLLLNLTLLPEASKHTWLLYVKEIPKGITFPNNFHFIVIHLPYLWTQLGLAGRTWIDKLDRLWIPAHTLPVLKDPRVKSIVTIHGLEYEFLPEYKNSLQSWYLPLSTQYATAHAERVIAVSEFTKQQLVERLGTSADKITVIHEGTEMHDNLKKPDDTVVLQKFGLQEGKYLIFIGTIQPRKNLVRLISAFDGLSDGHLKLVIAGKWGWDYDDVEQSISQAHKKNEIVTTGYISDMERDILLRNALVYVQPSITEGFGLPILEAFASNIPVVSSLGGALPEIVGAAGLVVDPLDVNQLTNSLMTLISDSGLRKQFIKKGRDRLKNFSWEIAARKTYNTIIKP